MGNPGLAYSARGSYGNAIEYHNQSLAIVREIKHRRREGNDADTALMMQQFYKHLANGMTKAEALKTVQQDFIQGKLTAKDAPTRSGDANVMVTAPSTHVARSADFSYPFYWAPFILIGNSL